MYFKTSPNKNLLRYIEIIFYAISCQVHYSREKFVK